MMSRGHMVADVVTILGTQVRRYCDSAGSDYSIES